MFFLKIYLELISLYGFALVCSLFGFGVCMHFGFRGNITLLVLHLFD